MILNYKEYILLESSNKIEVLKTKFKDISDNIFDKLVNADPTNNKAYLNWILNTYNKYDDNKIFIEDLYKVKEYLTLFDKLKLQHKLEHTDINYYTDYKELYNDISKIGGTGKPTDDENYLLTDRYYLTNGETELFYEDNDYLIVIPKTLEASKFYAKNTEWCTQYPDNFNKYSKQGNLFIIINKNLINTDNINRRLQFHFESNQFMNFNDKDLMANIKSKFINIFKNIDDNFKLKYDCIWNFENGLFEVKLNNKWGYINESGEEICDIKYDFISSFINGFAKVELNDKYGFINTNGEEICDIKYDNIKNFIYDFSKVKLNDKWGFIDVQGDEICDIKYDFVSSFINGFAKIGLNTKYGFINTKGKEICLIKYDIVYAFKNGFAKVDLNNKTLYIDEQGNEYDELPNK